jgi:2,5-furandicarboxylate decarboxylase 1
MVRTGQDANLGELPVPTFFELDSGAFITGGVGVSRIPGTGEMNIGFYRTLILGRARMAVNASSMSDLRRFYDHARQRGESMPIALAIGVDPALLMAAACKLPPDRSELGVAGALTGKPVELVSCETSELLVPANAEIIIEGRVDFSREVENTLGEFAGQYGPASGPVTEVTAITRRRDARFYSILAGRNPEHNTIGGIVTYSLRRDITAALRKLCPAIKRLNVFIDPRLGSMVHIVVSIDKQDDTEPGRIIDAAFRGSGEFFPVSRITKRIVVVDEDIDVNDPIDVEWAIWTRVAVASKIHLFPDVISWELDRAAKAGGKSLRIGIDATMDLADRDKLIRPRIPGAENLCVEDYVDPVAKSVD